jgi:hypothetical protein
MTDTNAGLIVKMGKGLDSYIAAPDEAAAELQQRDDGMVSALRRYGD